MDTFSYRTLAASILGLAETSIHPDEEAVKEAVKKRLTKKELKALIARSEGKSMEELSALLKGEPERIAELLAAGEEKFRHPKLRNHLVMGRGESDAS